MPSNTAAWMPKARATSLEVGPAPYTSPTEHQIVIKNGAVAINPVDWGIQFKGDVIFPWLAYPYIGGSDIAGEVFETGSGVTRFKVGDRVVGQAMCLAGPSKGGFQLYTVVDDTMAFHIPSTLSYESACVLPLGLSTASSALFQKDQLALQHPSVTPKSNGKSLLIWGGSTSVGSNAIQLAAAAGYEVVTTASPNNFEYVKKLGASQVFDYKSPTIVSDLIAAFEGKELSGAFAIGAAIAGQGSLDTSPAMKCAEVVSKSHGNKFVSCAMHPPKDLPEEVGAKFAVAGAIWDDEVGSMVYVEFLSKALAEGTFVAAPEAEVVGKGLESIQSAFEIQMKGVSAKKIVVSL